jgi:hypothetical protein
MVGRPEENRDLMNALNDYLSKKGAVLPENSRFVYGIDYVAVLIGKNPILEIGIPPTSSYKVEETKHTDKYLLRKEVVAV